MMTSFYGTHEIPVKIKNEKLYIDVEKTADNLIYKREYAGEKIEKLILSSEARIHINPIEPVNLPKEITPYLLIEFEKPLIVGPRQTKDAFMTFPVEIGVYISDKRNFELIDILALAKKKFTLYGEPQNGVICKYWRSDVYTSEPLANSHYEGILNLHIKNISNKWQEVTKTVFNAYGMKIYYSEKQVSMRANMKILSDATAETDFIDSPLKKKMKKSLELYTLRKLPIVSAKYIMQEGI